MASRVFGREDGGGERRWVGGSRPNKLPSGEDEIQTAKMARLDSEASGFGLHAGAIRKPEKHTAALHQNDLPRLAVEE